MVEADGKPKPKSRCCSACNLSKSKLLIVLCIVYIISTGYVVVILLEETRWIIKEIIPERAFAVCLIGAAIISGGMTFYMILYIPLWISLVTYHFGNAIVPLLYWIVLRIFGWVVFAFGIFYITTRLVMGIEKPVQYILDAYAFVDLVPTMINANIEPHGGAWGYLAHCYLKFSN